MFEASTTTRTTTNNDPPAQPTSEKDIVRNIAWFSQILKLSTTLRRSSTHAKRAVNFILFTSFLLQLYNITQPTVSSQNTRTTILLAGWSAVLLYTLHVTRAFTESPIWKELVDDSLLHNSVRATVIRRMLHLAAFFHAASTCALTLTVTGWIAPECMYTHDTYTYLQTSWLVATVLIRIWIFVGCACVFRLYLLISRANAANMIHAIKKECDRVQKALTFEAQQRHEEVESSRIGSRRESGSEILELSRMHVSTLPETMIATNRESAVVIHPEQHHDSVVVLHTEVQEEWPPSPMSMSRVVPEWVATTADVAAAAVEEPTAPPQSLETKVPTLKTGPLQALIRETYEKDQEISSRYSPCFALWLLLCACSAVVGAINIAQSTTRVYYNVTQNVMLLSSVSWTAYILFGSSALSTQYMRVERRLGRYNEKRVFIGYPKWAKWVCTSPENDKLYREVADCVRLHCNGFHFFGVRVERYMSWFIFTASCVAIAAFVLLIVSI